MNSDKALKQVRRDMSRATSTLLFDPEQFKQMGGSLTVSAHALTREQLLEYARTASSIRAAVALRAQHLSDDADQPGEVVLAATRSRAETAQAAADARNYRDAH